MTIAAIEGTINISAGRAASKDAEVLPNGAIIEASTIFRPNPDDDPFSVAVFNVFVRSIDFDGKIYMVKRPPDGCKPEVDVWHLMFRESGEELSQVVKPGEAHNFIVQAPENSIRYALAADAITPGTIHYRVSI